MELELTKGTMAMCRKNRLAPEQVAFADLVSLGWEPADAYVVAFRKGSTWVRKALRDEVEKLLALEPVKERIAANKRVLTERQKAAVRQTANKERAAVVDTAMSKEQMLYDLQTAVATMQVGSKEWLDTKKLIVDVTRMKQDEVQTDNNTIHHFLPVLYPTGCQDCLYSRCGECKYKRAYDMGQ